MALDSSDTKLAEKLRQEDPDQFQTLVRMHLSFVLDLNTDEDQGNCSQGRKNNPLSSGQQYSNSILHVLSSMWKDASVCMEYLRFGQHDSNVPFICYDCAAEKTKYRPSKWTFTPFAKKPKSSSKGVMEGAPLTLEGICQVYQLIEFLSKEDNIIQEGIFRRTGNIARQNKLKTMLNQGVALNLENGNFSVHDCASVLKNFLAELPEPLLTDAHYPVYCQIAELSGTVTSSPVPKNGELRLLRSIQLLLLLLPVENRLLLRDLMELLHLTVSYEKKNKMSADNLATIFTPHLLCPRKLTPEAFHTNAQTMSIVLAFMIRKGPELFEIPPKLATDIRAYWLEDEKRKLNAETKLNDGKRDGTAANTVFSFVDHELTAQAHSSNPTESALAQLYAHVQSMPESSKKRKLIRQFNKGNGQGTPVQLARGQKRHLRSKSLGDSIKKHIFNKSVKRQKNLHGIRLFGGQRSLSQESVSETMMTPRCRKPVVLLSGSNICHLANITNIGRSSIKVKQQHRSCSSSKDSSSKKSETANKNAEEAILSDKENALASSFCSCNHLSCVENTANSTGLSVQDLSSQLSGYCCESGDSLTSTFKSYLMSRSVLTASPVDLSFSSRTGDFDTSSESEDKLLSGEQLSDSLMYCLDGNDPLGSNGSDNEQKEECDPSLPGELISGSGETGFSDKYSSTSRSRICKEGVHETSL
ncbi:rho GTPase-activating protein 19 [Anabrus simplex]|uniref:rho GTPase-activating protein 19 n=1 Tax=Anabrus simplex TaxID=316456 RepID=UPI0035A3B7FB